MLIAQAVPEGHSIEDSLDGLAEKWNPLFEPRDRQNLVEDVNALVRDFLRPIRSNLTAKAPDWQRVRDLAERLSASNSLVKIAKKDSLKRYIELSILKCLSEM